MIKKLSHTTLFIIFLLALLIFVFLFNYKKYVVNKDYLMTTYTACDPDFFSCFNTRPDYEGFTFYSTPYMKVNIAASEAPICLENHTCSNFNCNNIKGICEIEYCSDEVLMDGEACVSN